MRYPPDPRVPPPTCDGPPTASVEALSRDYAPRVRAYARRHTTTDECDDVVQETFLIAWRRRTELPADPLPWLLVVARNILSTRRRSGRRADQLWLAAARDLWRMPDHASPETAVLERERHLAALATCTRPEREALLLVAWDGLSAADAAAVAGCSPRAFAVRLSRARARLSRALDAGPAAPPLTPRLAQETS